MEKARFVQENFLVADSKMDFVLEMPFFTLSNANIWFAEEKLTWKTSIIANALSTIKKVQIIDHKKFAKAVLNPNKAAFVLHVATVTAKPIIIDLACKAHIALLKTNKVFITISIKYSDFTDVFSKKSTAKLSEYNKINTLVINLEEDKQSLYRLIYSLKLMELETLKTYIETNLDNNFIRPFKSLASAPILFN